MTQFLIMTRWLKSKPTLLQIDPQNIDLENGILRNVVMCQAGPAKGHGVHLEESFIEALVVYDQKSFLKNGLKARFGHPAMSDTTMGTQMGHFRNFQKRDSQAIADLHLLDSADVSPKNPKMKEWMMSMAQESPDFVMSSIVFAPSGYYQYDPDNGERVDIDMDSWGDPIPKFKEQKIYVDFNDERGARHLYTDMVESGAATDNLFSQQFNSEKFAVRVIEWFQENPDLLTFVRKNPVKIFEMAEKLNIELKPKQSIPQKFSFLKNWLFGENHQDIEDELQHAQAAFDEALSKAQSNFDADLVAQKQKHELEVKKLKEQIKVLQEKHLADSSRFKTDPPEGDTPPGNSLMCNTTKRALKSKSK